MLPTSLQNGGSDYIVKKKDHKELWIYVKSFVLIAFVLGSALFVGSFLAKLFLSGVLLDSALLLPFVIATVFFLVFLFLLVFLTRAHIWLVYATALASALLIMLPLRNMSGVKEVAIVGCMLLVLCVWSVWNGWRESNASIKIRFVKAFRAVMSGSMWGIILLSSFLVYQSSILHPGEAYNILFPKSVFESAIPIGESLFKPVLGDIDFSLTLRQIAAKGIDSTTENVLGFNIQKSLTPELRDALIQKYITQAQDTFKQTIGITISPDQKISDAVYDGLLTQFNGLAPETQKGIVGFFTILFLMGLRVVAWLLGIIMIPIAFILYEIAILTGFATRSFTQEPKEHIGIQ
jgi:hypothetical protein